MQWGNGSGQKEENKQGENGGGTRVLARVRVSNSKKQQSREKPKGVGRVLEHDGARKQAAKNCPRREKGWERRKRRKKKKRKNETVAATKQKQQRNK